jgi:hypothetical protein
MGWQVLVEDTAQLIEDTVIITLPFIKRFIAGLYACTPSDGACDVINVAESMTRVRVLCVLCVHAV